MMPHDTSGVEAQSPAARLKLPAHIDIVAGDTEARIEAADLAKLADAEGHIATRNVLGQMVGDQDVGRAARCIGNAL